MTPINLSTTQKGKPKIDGHDFIKQKKLMVRENAFVEMHSWDFISVSRISLINTLIFRRQQAQIKNLYKWISTNKTINLFQKILIDNFHNGF